MFDITKQGNIVLNATETETDSEVLDEIKEELIPGLQIILYNDNFNTFDNVINSLIEVCKHDSIQAEQCTYLVHYRGKCAVKKGSYEELEPICTALLDRGLTAAIE